MDRGINPDTMQPLSPISSPEAKPSKANIKPVTHSPRASTRQKATSQCSHSSLAVTKPPTSTSRKCKGAKNAAPSLPRRRRHLKKTKVRNILNRASSAPGQRKSVVTIFFPHLLTRCQICQTWKVMISHQLCHPHYVSFSLHMHTGTNTVTNY